MKRDLRLILAAFLLAALLLSGCNGNSYSSHTFVYWDVLDTVCSVQVYLTPEQEDDGYEDWIHERLLSYHRLFDAYNGYEGLNNVYTINQNAGVAPVPVEEDLYEVIRFSVENMEETGGNTNIVLGSVTQIWKAFMNSVAEEEERARKAAGEGIDSVPTTAFPSEEELEG